MTSPSTKKALLDLFPVPELLLFSATGVVIGDEHTRFVQLKKAFMGNRFELIHATKIHNPKGAVESGLIGNSKELVPILSKMASHYDIRYVYAVLPEERAYIFTTEIDWVSADGLNDAVAFIIEENVPVALADSVFSFEIVHADRETGKLKVAVSVVPSDIVSSYTEVLKSAGVTPVSFELESQAIAKTVISRKDRRPQLIVNISWGKTGFYVVEDGIVQFSTTLAFGLGEDGAPPNPGDLKGELRKVLSFWNLHADNVPRNGISQKNKDRSLKMISRAIMCGPGAGKKDFVRDLMTGFDIEYVLADIWLNLSSRERLPGLSFEESLDYIPAVGLILARGK